MLDAMKLVADYTSHEDGLVVTNPANGSKIATVKKYSKDEVVTAIDQAEQAFKPWAARTAKERAGILRKWYELILENDEELAQIATAECGKPLFEARGEVAYAASFIEWFAEEGKRIYGDIIPTHMGDKRILALKQPIGVVAAITPWNFPLAMITRKVGPALAAGCTALVKPAEATPLSALALEKLAFEAGVPEGVLKTVTTTNPAEVGDVFTSHPTIKKITFTGSTPVGKQLMKQSAGTVKKVSMELGGNAPFIVFDDADLDAAVAGAMVSKYRNAGQTCVCANRFFVHQDVHDEFVEKFRAKITELTVGNGAAEGTDIGPLINNVGVDKVAALVENSKAAGAHVVLGGAKHSAGENFYAPTLLTGVSMDMEIANSEIFGPVSSIIKFKDEEEVIQMANDTPFGLACYFYTRDLGRAWRVAEGLDYGIVGINEGIISTEVAPFGGVKESGIGREGSKYGIDDYIEIKYCLMGGLHN